MLLCISQVGVAQGQTLGDKILDWIQGEPYIAAEVLPMHHTRTMLGVGQVGVQDTYLSEIAHTGLYLQLLVTKDFSPMRGGHWHWYREAQLHGGLPKNKANGATMYLIGGRYSIGSAYRALSMKGLLLDVAPLVTIQGQGNLKLSNTNNIGNVKAAFGLDAWARLRFTLPTESLPIAFQYGVRVPMIGLAFQPDYGQSYYDYASGENNAPLKLHFTSLHNLWSMDHRFLVDLPIRDLTISLGAEYTYHNEQISSLAFKQGEWRVLFGIAMDVFTLSGNKSARSSGVLRSID